MLEMNSIELSCASLLQNTHRGLSQHLKRKLGLRYYLSFAPSATKSRHLE